MRIYLLYWQVYLHKTGIGAEHLFQSVFKRFKELITTGIKFNLPVDLLFFLENKVTVEDFKDNTLARFARLDDTDLIAALKIGAQHDDFVLKELCQMILNRQLLKIKFTDKAVSVSKMDRKIHKLQQAYDLTVEQAQYFVFSGDVSNLAFAKAKPINILTKTGKIKSLSDAGDRATMKALSKKVVKHYYCYPKLQD